jgi:hypothetical protein
VWFQFRSRSNDLGTRLPRCDSRLAMGIEGVDGCGFSFDLVRTILGLGFLDVTRG